MRGDADIGTALSAGTVDARFWALVCDDEQWLRSEFDGIVSEPAEQLHAGPPASVVATDRSGPGSGAGERRDSTGRVRPWRTAAAPGRSWHRQRSPPQRATGPQVTGKGGDQHQHSQAF